MSTLIHLLYAKVSLFYNYTHQVIITMMINYYEIIIFLQLCGFKYSYLILIIFKQIYLCYGIAEGFRFMPLSLVRLRTFRLSTWVS